MNLVNASFKSHSLCKGSKLVSAQQFFCCSCCIASSALLFEESGALEQSILGETRLLSPPHPAPQLVRALYFIRHCNRCNSKREAVVAGERERQQIRKQRVTQSKTQNGRSRNPHTKKTNKKAKKTSDITYPYLTKPTRSTSNVSCCE